MSNSLKTMAVLAVLCVMCANGFAQEVNLNVQQEDPKIMFERYDRMKKVGTGLVIGGVVLGTTGIVLATARVIGADEYVAYSSGGYNYFWDEADADSYDKEIAKAAGWIIASSIGYSAMIAGIPIRVVGRVKAQQWKNKMPTAYIIPNGAKFVWNF